MYKSDENGITLNPWCSLYHFYMIGLHRKRY